MIWLVILGFALFFLSDINDRYFSWRTLRFSFPVGFLLVAAGTVLSCLQPIICYPAALRVIAGIFSLIFLFLTGYALFGALPVAESYAAPGEKRFACTQGVYALCRHPGVLFFIPAYAGLHFAMGLDAILAAVASLLNLLLALYEDLAVFPHVLSGYTKYQNVTPFLIPTGHSIRRCLRDYRKKDGSK